MQQRVVIVGAGQAGARTALALRKEGWQGGIVLVGAEPEYPYERPPLSKDVLSKGADAAAATILGEAQCTQHGIELRREQAVRAIDVARRELVLAGEQAAVPYDRLVLATGSRPRELAVAPAGLRGVHVLRTAADARAIAPRLADGASVVLIGGGFIGLEVAASARARGCRVTVLETAPQLMGRVVNAAVAEAVTRMHRARGVDVRVGVRIEALEGLDAVRRVGLTDGSVIDADLVVVGVGALANDGLPQRAGMQCEDGVLVDERAETSVPGVYAVGDVARHRRLWNLDNVRLESWENAELQAVGAARAIVGEAPAPRGVPWFWTDQYDLNLQLLGGRGAAGEQLVLRGSLDERSWCMFSIGRGRITGACLANAGRERRVVSQLMERGVEVDAAALADAARPLRSLLPAAPVAG